MLSSDTILSPQVSKSGSAAEKTPFHRRLRVATRPCHDEVDRLFGGFDLADAAAYAAFLRAHARALLPLEAWLDLPGLSAVVQARADLLLADLSDLGETPPSPAPLDWHRSEARRWGAAYVLEGSRLGGAMLKRAVPEAFPRRYLGAGHAPGGWRRFLAELHEQAGRGGAGWQAEAIEAAERSFALFADAARDTGISGAD